MQIARYVVNEARELVQENASFPAPITTAKDFYVTPQSDKDKHKISPHSTFEENGVVYVIGTKKEEE